jgi:RNA polymerase sigma factor (sigma-70 family)
VSNSGRERSAVIDGRQRLLRVLDEDGAGLHALLIRLTLRSDAAEDLLQDLFVNLSRSEGFVQCQNPAAYARQAAIHLAFNWRRDRKRQREEVGQLEEPATQDPGPLVRMVRAEEIQRVLDELAELPESSRELVVRRFIEGESYEQIAQHVGRTVHQARALCHKGIQRLRQAIGKEVRHVES